MMEKWSLKNESEQIKGGRRKELIPDGLSVTKTSNNKLLNPVYILGPFKMLG